MFSHQLVKEANPILEAIFDHPFVKGIGDGHVDDAALKFYVQQDFQYLSEFIKIYASIIPILKKREDMKFFAENIDFILNSEIHSHHVFCNIANVTYESLQHATPSPKAYLYQSHMYRAVRTGSLENIICALLPCPWTYNEIAKQLTATGKNTDDNPFKSWIDFYIADDEDAEGGLTRKLFKMLDELSKDMSDEQIQEAKGFFLKSTELEWEFWEQAFYQQDWRFAEVIHGGSNVATMNSKKVPQTLTIAGSDSGGGAGMQADIKTMQEHHVFSTSVVVGLTAQNTLGVQSVLPTPVDMINAQFDSVFDDFDIKAAKTGALFDQQRVEAVVKNINKHNIHPIVVDPVMVAKGGARLLDDSGIDAIINKLIPIADIVTPNLPEAEVIYGKKIENNDDVIAAATYIQQLGAKNVIVKGGHQEGDTLSDYVLLENGVNFTIKSPKYETVRKHGTGDTLSSAIVSNLAKGLSIKEAIIEGKHYIDTILQSEIIVGHGHGPLNHWGAEDEIR